jgi:hypothetical protein
VGLVKPAIASTVFSLGADQPWNRVWIAWGNQEKDPVQNDLIHFRLLAALGDGTLAIIEISILQYNLAQALDGVRVDHFWRPRIEGVTRENLSFLTDQVVWREALQTLSHLDFRPAAERVLPDLSGAPLLYERLPEWILSVIRALQSRGEAVGGW